MCTSVEEIEKEWSFNVSVGQEGLQQAQLMYAVVLTYILLRELGCYVCYLVVVRGKVFQFLSAYIHCQY